MPIFLKYNSKDGKKIADTTNDKNGPEKDDQLVEKKPNVLKRLQFFYTSPAVKFILNGITYLIFLGEYSFNVVDTGLESHLELLLQLGGPLKLTY